MAGSRGCTPLPRGAWGGLQRKAGNQFDVFKAANTARGHTSREGEETIEKHKEVQEARKELEANLQQREVGLRQR